MGGGAPVHSPMEKLSPISSHFGTTIGGGGMLHIQARRRAFADVITISSTMQTRSRRSSLGAFFYLIILIMSKLGHDGAIY